MPDGETSRRDLAARPHPKSLSTGEGLAQNEVKAGKCMSSRVVSSTARKREGWDFKCALTFRYNQAPLSIAYVF